MTSIDMKATGEMIKNYMDICGMSVQKVAECLSLGCVQSVYHWINGKSLPSVDNLYALAKLLNVPMDALIVGKEDKYICCTKIMRQRMTVYEKPVQYLS